VCVCDVRGAVWCRLGSVALEDLEKKKRFSVQKEAQRSRRRPRCILFLFVHVFCDTLDQTQSDALFRA
jgi:hypothetical protein